MIPYNLNQRELSKIVEQDGWQKIRQRGSHLQYKHPIKPGKVTIPSEVTRNIELSVFRQAGIRK